MYQVNSSIGRRTKEKRYQHQLYLTKDSATPIILHEVEPSLPCRNAPRLTMRPIARFIWKFKKGLSTSTRSSRIQSVDVHSSRILAFLVTTEFLLYFLDNKALVVLEILLDMDLELDNVIQHPLYLSVQLLSQCIGTER
jgi:hypothetical protein